ncbi:MAG: C40 family peptidase [Lachnospiraceae bacterium]|nr:C40 family peptidase [Lachnospiraceae bacterium]
MEKSRVMGNYTISSPVIKNAVVPEGSFRTIVKAESHDKLDDFFYKTYVKSSYTSDDTEGNHLQKNSRRRVKRADRKKVDTVGTGNSSLKRKKSSKLRYLRVMSARKRWTKGYIKHADLRDFLAKKGALSSVEFSKALGAVDVRYKKKAVEQKYRRTKTDGGYGFDYEETVHIQEISKKDKVDMRYPVRKKNKKTYAKKVTMSRKKYERMMNTSFGGRVRTSAHDTFYGGAYGGAVFSYRFAGQAGRSLNEKMKGSLKDKTDGSLSGDAYAEVLEAPRQIVQGTKGMYKTGKGAWKAGKGTVKAVIATPKNVVNAGKGIYGYGKDLVKSGKKFMSLSKERRKKILKKQAKQAFNSVQQGAKKAAKKALKKMVEWMIKLVINILGTLGGGILLVVMTVALVFSVFFITIASLFQIDMSASDGDSIMSLNNEAVGWEADSRAELSAYTASLPMAIVPPCPFGWVEKSWDFVFHASDVEDKVGSLWSATAAGYNGAINADPDIEGIVNSWGLEERDFEDTWINVYVLTSTWFGGDIGTLGGSTEEWHEFSADEIISVAESIYSQMCNEVQEENSVTMICKNYIWVPYDSDDDGIDDSTYPVLHTHSYTYYAVFRGIRSFDEMLDLMPWNTDTYSYCLQYDSTFRSMNEEQRQVYIRGYAEEKNELARSLYNTVVYSMSNDEAVDVEGLNEAWKGLLNMNSSYDSMSAEELAEAKESFPVINMTRAEFAELVRSYCEPSGQIPYLFGGKSTTAGWNSTVANGLDCTGFVDWIYRTAGTPVLQSGAGEMWYSTYSILESDLEVGDLVWKTHPYETDITHVGIFLGYDESGNPLFGHCAGGSGTIVNSYEDFKFYRKACVRFLDDLKDYEPEAESGS